MSKMILKNENKKDIVRKLIFNFNSSLDGLISEPKDGMDFLLAGVQEGLPDQVENLWNTVDTIIMGRIMYEGLSMFWPFQSGDFADIMNKTTKYVISTTLNELNWGEYSNTILLINEDINNFIIKLKKMDSKKNILLIGGGKTMNRLMESGLIDEFRISIHPVILGKGKPLWSEELNKKKLRLINSTVYKDSGMILLEYESNSTNLT